jgi:RimJ/RimL family protein N-acetyltransferase
MRIDCEQRPDYFEWASQVLDASYKYDDGCRVLTNLYDNGNIAAVIVYSRFHITNLEMSVASDGLSAWLSKTFLFQGFAYPFLVLGKRRVMAVVQEDNSAALHLDKRLGFIEEGKLRKWFGDKDAMLLGMLREECKWLKLAERNKHV